MEKFPPKPLSTSKTAAEILDELNLPHTEAHLRIAQAGVDRMSDLKSTLQERMASVQEHMTGFQEKIKALGVKDLEDLLTTFIKQKRELDRVRPVRDETEFALRRAIDLIPEGVERSNFMHAHEKAIRRAKTVRPLAPARPKSGPAI